VIRSLTANIGQYGLHCNSLVHIFLRGANVFTLDSNEHYFRSRNLALPQDSHSIRGSTRDLWTICATCCNIQLYPCSALLSEPGSSVSIVSGNGLDDRAFEVRFPAEAKDFSCSLCVQTGSGAHPASCTMITGGSFPRG
jgi:hypothetical protein